MLPLSPVYLVPLGLVVFGSPFVAIGVVYQRKNMAIVSWPRVKGRIVSSAIQTRSFQRPDPSDPSRSINETDYSADARFTYEVDGKAHEGTKISRQGISGGLENVQAWIHRHPPGTEVSVYVDPRDAATAYLEWRRWSVGSIILLVWGGVFVFAGLLVLAIFMLVGG